jgi:hypothetical protein
MKTFALCVLAACFPQPPVASYTPPDPAAIQAQQRESTARSMGYPTRKTAADLDALIAQQTKDFKLAKKGLEGRLDSPSLLTIDGVKGTCYTVVLRLGDGAAWGVGAEAGLRFDFRSPTGPGSGGPGVRGPGAVVSVGCAEASGPIALTMAPMIGNDPIGSGRVSLELWSHVLTKQEAVALEADKQRQIEEQREFAAQEAAKKQQRLSSGCSKCEARYQGCLGAGRGDFACRDQYRSCAFEEAGPDYTSACPSP